MKNLTESEWKAKLSPEQFHVLREKGTEAPFSGKLYHEDRDGMYHCGACGQALFTADAKYDSGCGWPAFNNVSDKSAVNFHEDRSYGMVRTEVTCKNCGSHLGHVFPDSSQKTGTWYCINSVALDFKPGATE